MLWLSRDTRSIPRQKLITTPSEFVHGLEFALLRLLIQEVDGRDHLLLVIKHHGALDEFTEYLERLSAGVWNPMVLLRELREGVRGRVHGAGKLSAAQARSSANDRPMTDRNISGLPSTGQLGHLDYCGRTNRPSRTKWGSGCPRQPS